MQTREFILLYSIQGLTLILGACSSNWGLLLITYALQGLLLIESRSTLSKEKP